MSEHTQEEWLSSVEEHGDYIVYVKRDGEEPGICSCDGSPFTPLDTDSEIEANYRLILATKHMLAALKGVKALLSHPSPFFIMKHGSPITNGDQETIDKVFIALDSALTKAEQK